MRKSISSLALPVAFLMIIAAIFVILYVHNLPSKQCIRAYQNYESYIDEINKAYKEDGFGEQQKVSLQQFCKK